MGKVDIRIRPSVKGDFQQLIELDNQVWHSGITPVVIHWDFAEDYAKQFPEGTQLVAVAGDVVCGYAGFRPPFPIDSNLHVAELNIAVHPDYHRQGIGKKLVSAVCEWAREQGKHKMSLRVFANNQGAIKLYESCGFREQGRLIDEFYIDGEYYDDVMMYKMLD